MNDLIKLLNQNARFSNEELAAMLGTTPKDIADQIEQLEKNGVIKGYSVILDESLADKDMVMAIIELKVNYKSRGEERFSFSPSPFERRWQPSLQPLLETTLPDPEQPPAAYSFPLHRNFGKKGKECLCPPAPAAQPSWKRKLLPQ